MKKKIFKIIKTKMSGRERGAKGLGRFVRKFDENETMPLFLQILPKKYHKDFQSANIREATLHTMINHLFEGLDIRDELSIYLDLPPRFRFVHVKETKPLYEKLCKKYQMKLVAPPVKTPSSPVKTPSAEKVIVAKKQQERDTKFHLKCVCQSIK